VAGFFVFWFWFGFLGFACRRLGLVLLGFGLLVVSLASAFCLACFTRRPCAGRHLLFFAAAKKSGQKKAAEHR